MNPIDLDLDAQIANLEAEWKLAYDQSMVARADYQSLAANPRNGAELIDEARERLERSESRKSRIMAKIERLEDQIGLG